MNTSSEYTAEGVARARATTLMIAQILGDELMRETVIVGGMVPTLRYAHAPTDPTIGLHIGTHDLDLALDLAVLDEGRYSDIEQRLSASGFVPDSKETTGALVRQRWVYGMDRAAWVEFIMPPVSEWRAGIQSLTQNLAAIRMLGIDLALEAPEWLTVRGVDLRGDQVERSVPVCRDGPFCGIEVARNRSPR